MNDSAARLVFWISLLLIGYAYVGYALFLAFLARVRPVPIHRAPVQPFVSVIIAAHNEEANLPGKLKNLEASTYPEDLIEIIVVSDGSTDNTNQILLNAPSPVLPILLASPQGKAAALNHAVARAKGEVLVFMDVRQSVDQSAISELVSCFADPQVGAVSGELHLETADGTPSPDALGIYWKIEKAVRKLESSTGSVVGVTGALFAMRRDLFVPLPPGTLLDDVLSPMQVVRQRKRVLFLESAIARDRIFTARGKEFSRKVRTLTGNYQLLSLAPWLLSPQNPLLFRLISHKLLRLLVPFLLISLLASALVIHAPLYHAAFWLQLCIYALALLGVLRPSLRHLRAVSIPYTFATLNVAALVASYNFIARRTQWN